MRVVAGYDAKFGRDETRDARRDGGGYVRRMGVVKEARVM